MEINVEMLINTVQNHFDNEAAYIIESKKKLYWKRAQQEKDNIIWHERNRQGTSNEITDLCAILNLDCEKLYTIARLARKWEKKHKWERCYPANKHKEQILQYLDKADKSFDTEINYIHWKINKHAVKKAA
jgi:hypothetical protein